MALFKICRGAETNLPTTLTSGYCYFCTDTTNFYIDYTDTYGALVRSKIAAKYADKLRYSQDGKYVEIDPTNIVTNSNYDTLINAATTSKNGLMAAADKEKLDGIASGANKTVVDTEVSDASENPVQNKVIKQYVDDESKMLIKTVVYDSETDTYSFENATGNEYAEFLAAWQDGRTIVINYNDMLYFGYNIRSDGSIDFQALPRNGGSTSAFWSGTISTTYRFTLKADNSLSFSEFPNCAYAYFIIEKDSDDVYKLYNYTKTSVIADPYAELVKLYKCRIPIKIFYGSSLFDVSYYNSLQLRFHSSDIKTSELPNKIRRLTITSSNEITYSESPIGQVALYYLKKDDDGNWTLLDAKMNVITTPYDELKAQYAALSHIMIYNRSNGKMGYIDNLNVNYLYIRELPALGTGFVFSNYYKITSGNVITAYTTKMESVLNKVSDIAANATDTVKYPNTKAVADYVDSKLAEKVIMKTWTAADMA